MVARRLPRTTSRVLADPLPLGSSDVELGNVAGASLVDPTPAGYLWRYESTTSGLYVGRLDNGDLEIVHPASVTDFQNGTESAPYLVWDLRSFPAEDWFRYQMLCDVEVASQTDVANNAAFMAIASADLSVYFGTRLRPAGSTVHSHDKFSHGALAAIQTGKATVIGQMSTWVGHTLAGVTSYAAMCRDVSAVTTSAGYTNILHDSTDLRLVIGYKANGTGGTCVLRWPRQTRLDIAA